MAARSLRVLVVEDSRSAAAALARTLTFLGHRPLLTYDSRQVLPLYRALRPDLVLLDVEMPDTDGFSLARAIRAEDPRQWTPIIFCSGRIDEASLHEGIESGGDDYLFKPVSPIVLAAKIRAMERIDRMRRELVRVTEALRGANRELERLSAEDPLTGLANRRALEVALEREYARARRKSSSLALVLVDVDYFKRYNDSLGHVEGDRCLRTVAHALGLVCRRSSDLAARYGGEEFSLILPETSLAGAVAAILRVRQILSRLAIPHPDSPISPYVTFSAGIVGGIPPSGLVIPQLLEMADRAMYVAKSQGRNRHYAADWDAIQEINPEYITSNTSSVIPHSRSDGQPELDRNEIAFSDNLPQIDPLKAHLSSAENKPENHAYASLKPGVDKSANQPSSNQALGDIAVDDLLETRGDLGFVFPQDADSAALTITADEHSPMDIGPPESSMIDLKIFNTSKLEDPSK